MTTTRKRNSSEKKTEKRTTTRKKRPSKQSLGWLVWVGLLTGVIVLALFLTSNPFSDSAGPIEGVQTFPNLDRTHTNQTVAYAQTPPVGGQHNAAWLNCGVYSEPVANENAVHSLEHGAIWITYRPDLPAEQLQELQRLTRQSAYRLLSPYPDLPAPVVASAWGYQLQLQQADDPRLLRFIEKYEQNPLGPEPGAACTGGIGTPG